MPLPKLLFAAFCANCKVDPVGTKLPLFQITVAGVASPPRFTMNGSTFDELKPPFPSHCTCPGSVPRSLVNDAPNVALNSRIARFVVVPLKIKFDAAEIALAAFSRSTPRLIVVLPVFELLAPENCSSPVSLLAFTTMLVGPPDSPMAADKVAKRPALLLLKVSVREPRPRKAMAVALDQPPLPAPAV